MWLYWIKKYNIWLNSMVEFNFSRKEEKSLSFQISSLEMKRLENTGSQIRKGWSKDHEKLHLPSSSFISASLSYYWQVKLYLMCTSWWFYTHINCERTPPSSWLTHPLTHICICVCVSVCVCVREKKHVIPLS